MSALRNLIQKARVRSPLLALAFCAMGGAFFGRGFFLLGGFCLLLAGLGMRRHWTWGAVAVCVLSFSVWKISHEDVRVAKLADELDGREKLYEVEGELVVGGYVWSGSSVEDRRASLRTKDGEKWEVVVSANDGTWAAARKYEVSGWLFLPDIPRNPGEMARRELWRAKGAVAGLRVEQSEVLGKVWWLAWQDWAERARVVVKSGILAGLDPEADGSKVILAMVLGEKPPADSHLVKAFRYSGSLHVFAVSGLHVTLVGSMVWLVLGQMGMSRSRASIVVIIAMFAYAILTGGRPPAIRASIMGMVYISAFIFRRRADLLNAWAFCLGIALLWRPEQLFDVGFQLSYGVLLSIALGVAFFERWTSKLGEIDSFLPRSLLTPRQEKGLVVRRWAGGMLAVSMAAWLGSLPLIAWNFGIVTPISILASLIMIPLTYAVLGLGFLSVIVGSFFPWGGMMINRGNEKIAELSFFSADVFAKVPGGHYVLPSKTPGEIVVYDLAGGAANWLQAGGGVLFDAGKERDFKWTIVSGLREWRVAPDTLVLSHPDNAHVGGMALALEKYGCGQAMTPVESALSRNYRSFLDAAGKTSCNVFVGKKGAVYELEEGVSMEVLWAGKSGSGWLADDQGMVIRLNWHGWKILFMGDAGLRATQELLGEDVDIAADLIIMGRHVSGGSGELGFLQKTGAKAVIVSHAYYPAYERNFSGWKSRVIGAGIRVLDQGATGAVIVGIDEKKLTLEPFLESEKAVVIARP